MRNVLSMVAVVVMILLPSCLTQRIYVADGNNIPVGMVPTYEGRQDFFIYGLAQMKVASAKEVCGKFPILFIETEDTFIDGLITFFTFGFYTPRTVKIYCKTNR